MDSMQEIPFARTDAERPDAIAIVAQEEFSLLTGRQIDVMEQLAAGLSNREIATKLGLSRSTVKTHILSIYQRMRCSNRIHLTLNWLQYRGMITINAHGPTSF